MRLYFLASCLRFRCLFIAIDLLSVIFSACQAICLHYTKPTRSYISGVVSSAQRWTSWAHKHKHTHISVVCKMLYNSLILGQYSECCSMDRSGWRAAEASQRLAIAFVQRYNCTTGNCKFIALKAMEGKQKKNSSTCMYGCMHVSICCR